MTKIPFYFRLQNLFYILGQNLKQLSQLERWNDIDTHVAEIYKYMNLVNSDRWMQNLVIEAQAENYIHVGAKKDPITVW